MTSHIDALNNPSNICESLDNASNEHSSKKNDSSLLVDICNKSKSLRRTILKVGVFSGCQLAAAGFQYTGDGDAARCDNCGFEVCNWTLDMNPFNIHSKQSPECSFVRSMIPSALSDLLSSVPSSETVQNTSISNEQQSAYINFQILDREYLLNNLREIDILPPIRRRTFSHSSNHNTLFTEQLIEAGFFHCNVGDRVICLYCNLICEKWIQDTDDPCEVHEILSPNCSYVIAIIRHSEAKMMFTDHESSVRPITSNQSSTRNYLQPWKHLLGYPAVHTIYYEISQRHVSFNTWPSGSLPSVDDLVRAGFFYNGTKTIVTCFYCDGSLQNWNSKDNPMIEHARWFPHCSYVKQLCGDELYQNIQESKRVHKERIRMRVSNKKISSDNMSDTDASRCSTQLIIPDELTLFKLIAARLDLPVKKRLLDQNFKLTIITKCWENQLRLKKVDFASDCDLYIACLILQKQCEYIKSTKENIVIPNETMKLTKELNEKQMLEQTSNLIADAKITTSLQSSSQSLIDSISQSTMNEKQDQTTATDAGSEHQSANSTPSNFCLVCFKEQRGLACAPCKHLVTCVPCGNSIKSCPICRQEIQSFFRIYI